MESACLRLVIAEDNALLRDGMVRLLSAKRHRLEVVGSAANYQELLETTDRLRPDVVVTDIRMPPTGTDEGIRAAAEFRKLQPDLGVVVLSHHLSAGYALTLLEGGSDRRAYLLKDRVADVDQLVDAIRAVAEGGSVIDTEVVNQLVATRRTSHDGVSRLSPREREVLVLMATGASNAAIASTLVLSERAVEKHISSIFTKLDLLEDADVNRRVRAVLIHLSAIGGEP